MKIWQWVLHIAILAGLLVTGMQYINGEQLGATLKKFNWMYAPPILALTVGHMCIKGWRLTVPMRNINTVNPWVVTRAYIASYGAALLPAGVTVLIAMLRQAKVPIAESAAAVLLASLLDQSFFISSSLIAALWVPEARPAALVVLGLLTVLVVLMRVRLTRLVIRNVIETVLHKLGWLRQWRDFLQSLRLALHPSVLVPSIGLTLLAAVPMVLALKLSLSSVGASATTATALLAYAASTMMGRVTPLPGGVGVTDAAMIALLNAAPNIDLPQAAAAVMIFRVNTTLLAGAIGALFYTVGWRGAEEKATEAT